MNITIRYLNTKHSFSFESKEKLLNFIQKLVQGEPINKFQFRLPDGSILKKIGQIEIVQDEQVLILEPKSTPKTPTKNTRKNKAKHSDNQNIIDIEIQEVEDKPIEQVLDKNDKIKIDLTKRLADTLIKNVFIQTQIYANITAFAAQSAKTDPIKETGGFLLGNYQTTQSNAYDISIEKFYVPTSFQYQDEYQLHFGTDAMLELDRELQKNNHLILIGWLHTHPGHTPFLSRFDLNVHFGSFYNPWQIAIVIDPLTPNCDTGFFTKRTNQLMNNKKDLKEYWEWKNLV